MVSPSIIAQGLEPHILGLYDCDGQVHYGDRKRRHPVTLIAAVICKDGILVGSDSLAVGDCGQYKQEKLHRLLDTQLIYGGSGDSRIIDDLSNWTGKLSTFKNMDNLTSLDNTSFNKWVERLSWELASQNGSNIKRVKASAGQEDVSIITSELLVAGYLEQKPLLITINRSGIPSYDTRQGFTASGSAYDRFVGALQALTPDGIHNLPLGEAITIFAKALDASIKNNPKTDFPVQMWLADNKQVTQILGLEEADMPTTARLEASSITKKQLHKLLDKASQPIKKSEKEKS